jgi:MinD superfamily P-loop ATPase
MIIIYVGVIMNVTFASGKGGAGKTFAALHFADFLIKNNKSCVLADLDVEEPDSALFFKVEPFEISRITTDVPGFDSSKCISCGKCKNICNFKAFMKVPGSAIIFKEMCHDCGLCYHVCPTGAIFRDKMEIGSLRKYDTGKMKIVDGILDIGVEQAVGLISRVKQKSKDYDADFYVYDAPPGIACSFVEAVEGSDVTVISVEDSLMGLHDGKLAIESLIKLGQKYFIVINKYINSGVLDDFIEDNKEKIAGIIPEKREIAEKYCCGNLSDDESVSKVMEQLFNKIMGGTNE